MKQIVCNFCGYDWNYKGRMTLYATCPNCKNSIKLKEEEQDKASAPFNAKSGGKKNG